ncbi:MAG: hypothetical protein DPW09_01950 [Anaerolineae bacterium]|nr:hypothetical protein [Anaerolineae bacterium]MCQ3972191.1 hypothetical protein [Anaerolineae bacterium]
MSGWKDSGQPTISVFIPPFSMEHYSRSGEEVGASPLKVEHIALYSVELLNEAVSLLTATLPAVDEEEARQAADYAEEVMAGQLALDLGRRIRQFLEAAQSGIGSKG